jgi:hypothetical protein
VPESTPVAESNDTPSHVTGVVKEDAVIVAGGLPRSSLSSTLKGSASTSSGTAIGSSPCGGGAVVAVVDVVVEVVEVVDVVDVDVGGALGATATDVVGGDVDVVVDVGATVGAGEAGGQSEAA